MAVSSSVSRVARRRSALGILPNRGGVKQRCDDGRRAYPDSDTSFHQLGPPLFLAPSNFAAIGIAHSTLFLGSWLRPYAERRRLGRAVSCAVA